MIKKLGLNFKNTKKVTNELKQRIASVVIALIIFRIGSFIPIPGIDTTILSRILNDQKGTIIEMFNMFSGGALSRASIFALGIMPYISSSIIIQLLTLVIPSLSEIKKEGEVGRTKINQYTRYTTLVLALFQSIGIVTSLPKISGMNQIIIHPDFYFYFTAIIILVTGTMFLMWLGELITECGIGNGISIIIFIGIIAGLPSAIVHTIEQTRQGDLHILLFLCVLILIFSVVFLVVFIERSQRKIIIHYAQRQKGRRIYSTQSTHLPLKINMAGVIPAIFASSVVLFPVTIISWFGIDRKCYLLKTIFFYFQPNQPLYLILYVFSIIFFCFFYTGLVFNPRETADNLKKSGGFISGIRPGEQTAKYINKIMIRLTLFGSLYIAFICLIPEFMRSAMNVPFYFGGTSLLIVVVVIMDFIAQIQTLIMSSQYESVLKKANLN
ncbi:preprotein translocase subunit SecY [Buchnera aphidicola]|jgi:preprotein translocase subunit SecY|uniref:Protein translocase subunit SecY n=1 Tax=Buchnera aphidicola subsp. Schizaphis graminum (strain Sg) TaxID=198804 RepID=SECY_BUCAP|nr:preprotein translocase subunit SecY [Buchnera aphidicola]Q8K969.1 RecName: Full=Protein translocase subunit SecY [Buchnera aphidicola str. Sg (Schizaphis graminum)]AAM68028.1 preprotein translocase SecY subunit [Buchnera aphidicola str. Sg (Schizaphis graminum)]AWI49482.1 preprotein translocase subunit SecY [Buchnera aphidicola (Schizaphis graminum)]